MHKRDVEILLTVEIGGVAAQAALQPVIAGIVTRLAGKGVVIPGGYWRNACGNHRLVIARQG